MALEEARADVAKLRTEKYLAVKALEQERQAQKKKVNPNQILHEQIVNETVDIIDTIKTYDSCTLWWVNQWVNECLTELATTGVQKFKSYKDFCIRNKKKKEAGMKHFKVTPFSPAKGAAAGSD
jgi:hypothetical protein